MEKIIQTKSIKVKSLKVEVDKLKLEFETLIDATDLIKIKDILPATIIQTHISKLKEYNELKDTGMHLAQMVSRDKGCTINEVIVELGYEMDDEKSQ